MGLSNLFAASLLALRLLAPVAAAPTAMPSAPESNLEARQGGDWWFASIERNGAVPFGKSADYPVFRNVKDYGAVGDGSTDDTVAINAAITDGERCGNGCDSSTNTPALVYFPPGTYMVSTPIIPYYYTHMVGNLNDPPTLKGTADFSGMAIIDANPYNDDGTNWFTNQNNFFRQVRNFVIDLTGMPMSTGTGIHWQVAQATSLQNIVFNMVEDRSEGNAQQGLFIDNGSGGFMTDLTFNGGKYGAFVGSQQFTLRNMVFNNCNTAIFMNWNWVWILHGFEINNCGIGVDMSAGILDGFQTVGSILLVDSVLSNTEVGVATTYSTEQTSTNGTLILDNVDMSTVPVAVKNQGSGETVLAGNAIISSWVQGRVYQGADGGKAVQAEHVVTKPEALLDGSGKFVTKSKPQYADVPASSFVSVKGAGAKGDGQTDDTAAIQAVFDSVTADQIVYFDHGAYIITDTIQIPPTVRVVGEIWPLLMAGGNANFQDQANPKPMLRVGKPGDVGNVEMSDLMLETKGAQPGAILLEWNVAGESKGSAGLFDVHARVGGSAGTELQSDKCAKDPDTIAPANPECIGAFMLVHVTSEASIYMENTWLWVSDHELDRDDFNQINIYNGRGILLESTKGAWLWGTASEHSVLHNYHFQGAQNVFLAVIQTETAYYQGNPDATTPFNSNPAYYDPDFSTCSGDTCARTWGMRIVDSSDVLLYGGGLYSFFNNYDQECVDANNCQDNMVDIVGSTNVSLLGVSTKAAVNMIQLDGQSAALDADNRNNFCASIAAFSV